MAKLSQSERDALPKSKFAEPEKRAYARVHARREDWSRSGLP